MGALAPPEVATFHITFMTAPARHNNILVKAIRRPRGGRNGMRDSNRHFGKNGGPGVSARAVNVSASPRGLGA
jgi:hypothetical protein